MANKKITALPQLTSPAGADVLAIVDDVAGTPTTKQVTATNLMGLAPVQSVAGRTGTVTVDAGDLTDGNFDGTAISGFNASINDKTDDYTLLASDNGKVVVMNKTSAVTVTVPSGLGVGFNCSFIQKGAGQVSFSASGTTIYNRQSHTKINGQYGVASIVACTANTFILAGDTAS